MATAAFATGYSAFVAHVTESGARVGRRASFLAPIELVPSLL
jgi:hypothetical protein